jgi:hypothetical protein
MAGGVNNLLSLQGKVDDANCLVVSLRPRVQAVIETAAPAAGAESITTVPAGKYWRMASFICTLTTDATVATRLPTLVIDDGTNILIRLIGSATVGLTASSSASYCATVLGTSQVAITGVQMVGPTLPDPTFLVLQPGWRIRTSTTAIAAGDQWGIARLVVQESETA